MISLEDFKKVELKIGVIETVISHPNADRLYVLGIKVGDTHKTVVAGIRKHYGEDELKGKKIVIVNNLEPATIRGVESQGMLVAASEGEGFTLIAPERPITDGAGIR